jgi:hypothetical protein
MLVVLYFFLFLPPMIAKSLLSAIAFFFPLFSYVAGLAVASARMCRADADPRTFAALTRVVAGHAMLGATASLVWSFPGIFPGGSDVPRYAWILSMMLISFGWLPGLLLVISGAKAGAHLVVACLGAVGLLILFSMSMV